MCRLNRCATDFLWFFGVAAAAFLLSAHAGFALEIPGGQTKTEQLPSGQTAEQAPEGQRIGAEVLGGEGGYFHPFLMVEGKYTDNLYYTSSNEEDEIITTVTPGIWVAVPANREKVVDLSSSNTSPGGLALSRIKPEATRRMQTYFLYSPEFAMFAENSDKDYVNHKAVGAFQYNFDAGLSIDLVEQFGKINEINNNATGNLDEYYDNLVNLIVTYDLSKKFKIRADYSNYWLDYDESVNEYRNRMDNSGSVYVFYQFKPKTSAFVQYDYADISYDEDSTRDSQQHGYFAGVDWDVTAKTRGRAKIGYTEKRFEESGLDDESGFAMEVQAQHTFTPKRAINVSVSRNYKESANATSYAAMSSGVNAALLQRFTAKWSGTASLSFTRDEYEGEYTLDGKTDEREDDTFRAGASLIFEPRDWLTFDLGYYFSTRDSNFSVFDFDNNTVYISVELVM